MMHQPGPYAQQQPHDPYRAQAPGAAFAPIGSGARWAFTVIVVLMGIGFGVAVVAWTLAVLTSESATSHQPDDTLMGIGFVGVFGLVFLLYAQIAAGLVWLYKAWSWLPWDQRYTRHWRGWVTPSQVALMMLIPYFHYYWMFVANCGLCDALDRLRVSYPTREAAPKNLAIAACVCQFVIPFPVGSLLWLVFMSKVERMTREMSAAMGPRAQSAF
jgi:hypothetical protein